MPIQLLTMPERRLATLLLPDPERRLLRFLFRYANDFCAMAWMQIAADGSLYLNPRRKAGGPAYHAEGVADGKGGMADLLWVEIESADVQNPKVSHHASGLVKAGSSRSMSVNVREVQEAALLRMQDYSHPSRFDVPENQMRETDIVVPWYTGEPDELYDDKPLTSRVWVASLRGGHAQVPCIDDIHNAKNGQTAIVVPAKNLKNCQDLTYQVQFFSTTREVARDGLDIYVEASRRARGAYVCRKSGSGLASRPRSMDASASTRRRAASTLRAGSGSPSAAAFATARSRRRCHAGWSRCTGPPALVLPDLFAAT